MCLKETVQLDRPSKVWTVIGKFAVVVTILAGGIAVWTFFFQEKPSAAKVSATGYYFDFQLPPDLLEQVEVLRKLQDASNADRFLKFHKSDNYDRFVSDLSEVVDRYVDTVESNKTTGFDAFRKYVTKQTQPSENLSNAFNATVSSLLTDYVSSAWSEQFRFSVPAYRGYLKIQVENSGNKEANNVELILPYDGISLTEAAGAPPQPSRVNGRVVLGRILPQHLVTVRLWTTYSVPHRWDLEKWHLSYTEGIGTVRLVGTD